MSRFLRARLAQLKSEMDRYGIHPVSQLSDRVIVDLPPSLAVRFRAADLIRQSREGTARRAS